MNHEHNAPTSPPPADPELEARIVAWVLGEAAAAEIAALEPLVAARPELAVFKRRIEAVHGLVAEAARPDAAPLRLAPARRAKLLATLASPIAGGAEPGQTAASSKAFAPATPSAVRLPRPPERPWWQNEWLYSAAACLVITIGGFWMLGTVSLKSPNRPDPEASVALSIPFDAEFERDSEELPEPENTVGFSAGFASPTKAAPPAFEAPKTWAPPAKASRSLDTAKFKQLDLVKREVAASTTLAGTRLNTELRDIGSAVTVVTNEFMKDLGATDNKALLDYTSGNETGGSYGNFGGEPLAGKRDDFLSKRKGSRAAPPAPAALGGEKAADKDEEVVVLSPFEVTKDTSFLKGNRPLKKPKRPDPSATSAGMGPGGLNADQALQPAPSTSSTLSTDPAPPAADDKPLAKKPAAPPPTADELSAAQEPVSTFSLHVSDASFKLALAALNSGSLPEPASIRPEEFYNAFDYGDPAPAAGEQVSCRVEQAAHPFAQQRNLVRLAVRVPATGRGAGTPLHLTVLLDTSGSMERPDRRAAVRAALATLVGLLGPNDRLTLVGFARQPRLLAEAFDGAHASQALGLLDRTPAEGGTNLEEALKLGGELARRHFAATAQNRIVLLTDGAANLGDADPERLAAAIESLRSQRIAFDACGVGLEGVDDDMLEALTRKGDGRYYVLNSPEAADAGFARQLAGAFRPAAENVKLQVRFNPARVGRYRLVGFEKHRLREEDFRNDAVDAAEISAEEAAVAVYEVEALPQGEGELGEVFVRFRDPTSRTMVERSWTLPFEPRAAAFDRASSSLQLAGTAAALAEKLRGGPAGDRVDLDALAPVVNALRSRRPDDKRLQDLTTMFEQLRKMKK